MGWSTISVQQWCKWRTTAPRTSGLCPRFSFYTKPWFFEEEVAETWLSMQARNKMICWQESKMKTNVCEIEVHVRQEKFISTHQVPPRTTWRNTSCIVSLPSGTRSTTSAPVRAALTAATLRKTVGEREKNCVVVVRSFLETRAMQKGCRCQSFFIYPLIKNVPSYFSGSEMCNFDFALPAAMKSLFVSP